MTIARHHHWIGGRQVIPKNEKYFEDLNPLDDSLYAEIAEGDPADVAMAVETAHASFGSYRHSLPKQREAWLLRAAELLENRTPNHQKCEFPCISYSFLSDIVSKLATNLI